MERNAKNLALVGLTINTSLCVEADLKGSQFETG